MYVTKGFGLLGPPDSKLPTQCLLFPQTYVSG